MVKDQNHESVQIGSEFQTQDNSGTPKTSPLAYSSTEIAITIPDNAVEFIVYPSTDLRVSEVTGMARYDVITAASKESIPCARMTTIYIKRDTADGNLNFRFTTI